MDLLPFLPAEWTPIITRSDLEDLPTAALAALMSALTTLILLLVFNPRGAGALPSASWPARRGERSASPDCEFLLRGSTARPLTDAARAMLRAVDPRSGRLSALTAHLERDCPGFRSDLEELILHGTAFRRHCQRRDGGAVEISGWPSGDAAHLAIRPASEDARALSGAQGALARAEAEARLLRRVMDSAPLLAWSLGADGQVDWSNQPYQDRFGKPEIPAGEPRGPDAFAQATEQVPLTARGAFHRRRVSLAGTGEEPEWYEVSELTHPEGGGMGFALASDDLVNAESALRRFVETLTETFAHLPIGLAVFDKNRRLGLFNPALTDLVKIDAVWLAARPSLRDFLERLRETRQMPDMKDFTSWRRKLGELEDGAREGTYEENWVLPSGKIFRVTGRPHPQGAVAFLFEDISKTIQLERRYRSELELSQAALDRVPEAVAVFDASGGLVFVNAAFRTLWHAGEVEQDRGPARGLAVAEVTARCGQQGEPSTTWARIADFATGATSRASFGARVTLLDGRELDVLAAPMPNAASLVIFRDLSAERRRLGLPRDETALVGELAFEQLRGPAEFAARELAEAISAIPDEAAFEPLRAAARDLREGLEKAEALGSLGALRRNDGAGPLPLLTRALENRGLTLAVTGEEAPWPYERGRFAWRSVSPRRISRRPAAGSRSALCPMGCAPRSRAPEPKAKGSRAALPAAWRRPRAAS